VAEDGTYTEDVGVWNATQDKASMAAGAIDSQATVVVKNGVATMYITTKEMTMGTIKAWLEELYIGSSTDDYKSNPAVIVSKNADG
ncbi:NEAT domain-containing protein, partial [Blautia wexlerae]|uniref:NEAT domain-containing protein n=1 Tax=Blautia wexlerae TaxID=418240 RepID=UPI001D005B77